MLLTIPRSILGLDDVEIDEGIAANITIFDPTVDWTFSRKDLKSKSKSTPFDSFQFNGKVLGIINRGKTKLF